MGYSPDSESVESSWACQVPWRHRIPVVGIEGPAYLKTRLLERTQEIDAPLERVFDFFSNAENLEALTPPFLGFKILSDLPIDMHEGARIEYSIKLLGIPMRWSTLISVWEPGARFVDEQVKGPYAIWHHTHEFKACGDRTEMRDIVKYREPLGPLGALANVLFVKRMLDRIFDFRMEAVREILEIDGAGETPAGET